MRVLMVSKACVVGMYQRKLEELAAFADVELSVVVPPYWRDGRRVLRLEKVYTSGYDLHVPCHLRVGVVGDIGNDLG